MNLKIQILAENTLMSRFHVGFEIELPLLASFREPKINNIFCTIFLVQNTSQKRPPQCCTQNFQNRLNEPAFLMPSGEHQHQHQQQHPQRQCLLWACKACKKRVVRVDRRHAATLRERKRLRKVNCFSLEPSIAAQ